MQDYKYDDEHRPTCPVCHKEGFKVISNERVARSDKAIAFVICADDNCQTTVDVLPFEAVWDQN